MTKKPSITSMRERFWVDEDDIVAPSELPKLPKIKALEIDSVRVIEVKELEKPAQDEEPGQ